MSTIYSFNESEVTIDAMAVDDLFPVYDTSTGSLRKITGAQVQERIVTAASTAANLTATGVSTISSLAAAYTLAAPVIVAMAPRIVPA